MNSLDGVFASYCYLVPRVYGRIFFSSFLGRLTFGSPTPWRASWGLKLMLVKLATGMFAIILQAKIPFKRKIPDFMHQTYRATVLPPSLSFIHHVNVIAWAVDATLKTASGKFWASLKHWQHTHHFNTIFYILAMFSFPSCKIKMRWYHYQGLRAHGRYKLHALLLRFL